MSDEGFLKRWSRRKRTEAPDPTAKTESPETLSSNLPGQAGDGSLPLPSPAQRGKAGMGDSPPGDPAREGHEDDAIDPATLPPLETLGPDSDYTVFLRRGVPEALRNAALRKAWMSDPFIRDFRGPAEYAIDYTTSEFDLLPTDDVAKMLERIFPPKVVEAVATPDAAPPPPADLPHAPAALPAAGDTPPAQPALPQKQAEEVAPLPQAMPEIMHAVPTPARRKHGGALPDEPIDIG
jgi:hypothetical protein